MHLLFLVIRAGYDVTFIDCNLWFFLFFFCFFLAYCVYDVHILFSTLLVFACYITKQHETVRYGAKTRVHALPCPYLHI